MRFGLLLTMFFIVAASGSAQTTDSLRAKYGRPTSETYDSGKGVMLTATFDDKGATCSLLIDRRGRSGVTPSSAETLSDADANRILDDLAPTDSRGKYIIGTFLDVICMPDNNCFGSSQEYEKLTITWIGNKDHFRYVYLNYKRNNCH